MNNEEIIDIPITEVRNGRNRILNDSSIFFKGLFGMILCIVPAAIIGLVLIKMSLEQAREAIKEYEENPVIYRVDSIKRVKLGKTFAYIGLFLFILELIALVAFMSIND